MSFSLSVRPFGAMITKLCALSLKRKTREALYRSVLGIPVPTASSPHHADTAVNDDVRVPSIWDERPAYVPEAPTRLFALLLPYLR